MKQQKTSGVSKLVASLLGAALLGLATQNAMALTAAGAPVDNTASLTYAVGGVTQNSINSSPNGNTTANTVTTPVAGAGNGAVTSFTVDYKVDLSVTGGTIVNVTPGQAAGSNIAASSSAYLKFTVQNLSNSASGFSLAALDAATGVGATAPAVTDAFNVTNNAIYVDGNNSGTLDAADTLTSTIPTLAANGTITVFVASAIPITALNAQSALISLTATAVWNSTLPAFAPVGTVAGGAITATTGGNTAGVDVVFADAAGVVDVARDAKHSAYDAYTIASAVLNVKKSVALLCDPVNGATNPMNIPGAAVQYAITITNSGTASATLAQISDALAATVAWDAGLISGAGAGSACVAGAATTLSGSGFGAVNGAGLTTSYVAPGLASQATAAGATVAGAVGTQTVTVDFPTLTGGGITLTGGVLPTNSFVTVYFNTFVQ